MKRYQDAYRDEWFSYRDLNLFETGRQQYASNGCIFAAGCVNGHPTDTLYLVMEKDGQEATLLLFRSDEMAAIAWLCSGALWTNLEGELMAKKGVNPFAKGKMDSGKKCAKCGKSPCECKKGKGKK